MVIIKLESLDNKIKLESAQYKTKSIVLPFVYENKHVT